MTWNVQSSYEISSQDKAGKLYLVATPIGNLEDMTYRAVRILQEVEIIAAEDTRETRKLLSHFDIQGKKLYSHHEHNKWSSGPELVRLMEEGQSIALVSDAGLPAISDPGAELVRLAIDAGIAVIPIPGANAALSALIASGLSTERFLFVGFLPRDRKRMEEALLSFKLERGSIMLYESPHRVVKTLERMLEVLGDRQVVLARELTKRYEQFIRGSITECLGYLSDHAPLGECVLVLEGISEEMRLQEPDAIWWNSYSIHDHVEHYEEQDGLSRKDAMKAAAKDRGVSKRDIYQALLEE
ncbi:16S rRNA (cytidine(1402)-2'-O)-methyltransferase [Paenibacillus sp. 1001270B_150601_E10]|uniref:16S rRNA (cytidine(1402)-2'-O)-methyltransferase n=1 Tax=Paenibacillus sp. 1001270B_150601_E10 TaxID=2787079 RepID=UPI00189FFACE|nr:16S rRNA (cytidine(1402)-2'-O)-methyltransferase [Paenibacillus sp. 1001270B_150601_E10]